MSDRVGEAGPADLHSLTLVLASPRTGSTLLCRDIASLGGLGFPREYFRGLEARSQRSGLAEEDLVELVGRGVVDGEDGEPGVAAVKLMTTQAGPPAVALTGRRPDSPAAASSAVVAWARQRFDRVLLVVLVRNALDQAISKVVAETTGRYHSTQPEVHGERPLGPEDTNVQVMAAMHGVLRNHRVLHSVAAEHSDIALLLTYDDLTTRVEETTSRLVAHARKHGFEPHREAVTRRLSKLVSPAEAEAIRESFLDYLRTETGADWPGLRGQ